MKAQLILTQPQREKPQVFQLDDLLTIGRDPNNTIFLDDDLVSRNHALVRRVEGEYRLLDLGSSNGTYLNDKPVTAATPLNDNDTIKMGGAILTFRLDVEPTTPIKRQNTTQRVFATVNLAVLVSDVRGYTSMSETLPAEGLSTILADWFRHVGTLIEQHEGSIEKIRGDSILAYWLTPAGETTNTHIVGALRTARDMVEASRSFDDRIAREYPGNGFKIGCAVHTGDAILGNIGADARRDFTTLGDCINVTFRIESLCGPLQREILTSEEIVASTSDVFSYEDLGPQQLKGKPDPIRIFAVC